MVFLDLLPIEVEKLRRCTVGEGTKFGRFQATWLIYYMLVHIVTCHAMPYLVYLNLPMLIDIVTCMYACKILI